MPFTRKDLPVEAISECCKRFQVAELSVFGSVARGTAEPDSDVDFLVEFDPDAKVGLLHLCGMANELSDLIGRKVDLGTKSGLKPLIREEVLSDARVLYTVEGCVASHRLPPAQALEGTATSVFDGRK